jgi:hypothetical protein
LTALAAAVSACGQSEWKIFRSEDVLRHSGPSFWVRYPREFRLLGRVSRPFPDSGGFPIRIDVAEGADPETGAGVLLVAAVDGFGPAEARQRDEQGDEAYWKAAGQMFGTLNGGGFSGFRTNSFKGFQAADVDFASPVGQDGAEIGSDVLYQRFIVKDNFLIALSCVLSGAQPDEGPERAGVPGTSGAARLCAPFLDSLEFRD